MFFVFLFGTPDSLAAASYVSRSGRSDVKRVVVTAAAPVFVSAESSSSSAKATVVGALKESIQSGEFLSLTQDN